MKTILIVEDNPDIRDNLSEMLELSGYKVLSAENGKAGLAFALEHLPDLILSDYLMPLMNGRELFEELKKEKITSEIPFVFITSSVEKKEIQFALNSGVNGYICKPFEEEDLLGTLEKCLRG